MPKIACCVEYKGHAYSGWQYQNHSPSIQEHVERALSSVANQDISVICAGRTDAGVHATGQIIHFDTTADRDKRSWLLGANRNLPRDIALKWVSPVEDDFHARFSAFNRSYRYIIHNTYARSALLEGLVTTHFQALDVDAMHKASQYLLGEHDFSSYRASQCQANSPVREITSISVQRSGEFIYLDVSANAFLHHMIRNIAGVLITIGAGEADSRWAKTVLDYRDRMKGGVTAKPNGLYLVRVQYPEIFNIPVNQSMPQFSQ